MEPAHFATSLAQLAQMVSVNAVQDTICKTITAILAALDAGPAPQVAHAAVASVLMSCRLLPTAVLQGAPRVTLTSA